MTDKNASDLLTCPFCGKICMTGKNGQRYSPRDANKRDGLLFVQRYGFGCSPCGFYLMVDAVKNDPFSEATRAKAAKKWNTRPYLVEATK